MSVTIDDLEEPPDSLLEALAATPGGEVLPRRTVVDGQYRIERVVGEGGMGVVYLARDLRLDREVAIKVGSERSAAAIGWLAREALALARLSHPNVVVIYQVGELDGRSYVAMEYVPDGTARTWCEHRHWRDIVGLYLGAGTGLAAAHAAGLVHRDFKPDNVLVGADGRPRVADFGLARALTDARELATEALPSSSTRTAGIAGTPAYMAPEQASGGDVDARADQFAFCASLWEALFGERPFAERTTERDGVAIEPPRALASDVPKHVELALRRGMAVKRDDRWPALEPLLAELRRGPRRRRTALAVAAAGVALAATVTGGLANRGGTAGPCDASEAALGEAWSPARAAAIRANLAPATAPLWVQQSSARAVETLDHWARRWTGQFHAVCEAGQGVWSRALADRGVACLAQRKRALVAAVGVLSTAHDLREHVDQLVERLDGPEQCADAAYLTAAVPPPANAAQAARIEAAQAELETIHATAIAGQLPAAKALIPAAFARATTLAYPPLTAQAELLRGTTEQGLGEYAAAFTDLHDAYFAARTGGDARTATLSASAAALALLDLSRDTEAVDWAHLAEAEATATGDPRAEASATSALAAVTKEHGDPKRALAYAEKYLALARRVQSSVPQALRSHAGILDLIGDYAAALADLDDALRVVRDRYGEHPELADIERERALVLLHLHRIPDAVAAARRAVDIASRLLGPDSAAANNALAALGVTLKDAKQYDEALAVLDRSLALTRAHDGPRSFNMASDLNNRGDLLSSMHRTDEALATWADSSAIFSEVVGAGGNEVAIVELNIWNGLYQAERIAEGAPHLAKALPILAKTPDSSIYAQAVIAQGMAEIARGDAAHAKEHLEAGLAKLDDDPRWRIRGRFALAKVRLALGDGAQARTIAAQAREDARASGANEELPGIERFLARLPPPK